MCWNAGQKRNKCTKLSHGAPQCKHLGELRRPASYNASAAHTAPDRMQVRRDCLSGVSFGSNAE
eukprot:147498-Alexandrium_andersonii.AAC.1